MTVTLNSLSPTEPDQTQGFRHGSASADALVAAVLRDYATVLTIQQGLRAVPQDVHRAYEALHGAPLDVETLCHDLRGIAAQTAP